MPLPIRLLFDEHIDPAIINGLRSRSIEAMRFQEMGRAGFKDFEQFAFAAQHHWVIGTHDTDFPRLHHEDPHHAGVF